MKEIVCHGNFKSVRIYWGYKTEIQGDRVHSRSYWNGVPQGFDHETIEDTTQYEQADVGPVYDGDLLQIYGLRDATGACHVLDMEIRWNLFINQDP